MTNARTAFTLSPEDLRTVAAYAAACARSALHIFERDHPTDARPRAAIEATASFANGAPRTKSIRDAAWAAQRAAHDARAAHHAAASEAARAALAAAGAPFLHPLPNATQVKHILGAAAHAARAFELVADNNPAIAATHLEHARARATPALRVILRRFPPAPPGGARVGELMRQLDLALR